MVQVEQELEARALIPLVAVPQGEKVELVLPEVVLLELLVLVLEQVQSGLEPEPETETLVPVQSELVQVQSALEPLEQVPPELVQLE